MRLFEVIDGQANAVEEPNEFETFMNTIESECSMIWNMYKNTDFLYRGVKTNEDIVVKSIRNDRRPTDLDPRIHELSIEAYKKLGVKAHRGNSIFCSPDQGIAEAWGDPYIVFPTDPFQFSYLMNWREFAQKHLSDFGSSISTALNYPYFMLTYLVDHKTTVDELAAILQEAGLARSGLPMAIENELEVLITGRKYYAVSTVYEEEVKMFIDMS